MKRTRSLAMIIAGALCLSIVTASSALGQTVPRQLPPEPPPELPSVSDYSLPPGNDQNSSANQAQGPVEENAAPPQATPSQNDAASSPQPAAQSLPLPATPQPTDAATTGSQARSVPTDNRQPDTPANSPQRAVPSSAPTGERVPAIAAPQNQATGGSEPQPGFTSDLPAQTVPSTPRASRETSKPSTTSPAPDLNSGGSIPYFVGGAIILLLLGGLRGYFFRRKTAALLSEEEPVDHANDITPLPAEPIDPTPALRKSAPKIYSPPNPAEPEPASPTPSNGFVTSKIGFSSEASQKVTEPRPAAPKSTPKSTQTDCLQIDLIATGASSTLLNAVLNYAVTLTNRSDQLLRGIRLSGAMMQANSENARNGELESGELLHEIEELPAGETISVKGDIRLPLNAIRPITIKAQALFIPLARFGVVYLDQHDVECQQIASFIIGREYEPRRPKMAPFRLDLGPKIFEPVGQRPLNT
ncbi:hypothetical protein [Parasphingorhabdus litoris]|nr:hypothetical protein [Parasphingorhabdus litoris]